MALLLQNHKILILLIEPFGIETRQSLPQSVCSERLLIEPFGIETDFFPPVKLAF